MNLKKTIIITRIFLWLILAIILGWLIFLKIVPTGHISYRHDFGKYNFFIGKLTPAERVAVSQGLAQIKGDPVYFSLKTPRRFERASATVKFKNTTVFPVMEIGLLSDKIAWSYDLKPLENKIIDQLALVWPVIDGPGGARLIERRKNYETMEKFLNNLPSASEIALYDYSLKNKFLLAKYAPGSAERLIDYRFRGAYQFYTYIKNETLEYAFDFVDLNINKDNDPVDIKVYSPAGLIYSKHLADDPLASPERQSSFKIADLPEGAYRISFTANDDIVTRAIISRQSQFALINKVWLAGDNKKNLVLYTNSRQVSAQTANPASLGKIRIGQGVMDLNKTYQQFSLKIAGLSASQPDSGLVATSNRADDAIGGARIELAKDDIIISGDGVFSLDQAGLIDPRYKNVDKNIDVNQEKINYILTNYKSPSGSAEWQTATVDFDLTKAYQENGKYQFLISVPGLKAEEANQGEVIVKEIKVNLFGVSLWQKVKRYFKR